MPRINKCIELLEQGQPIYVLHDSQPPELSYDCGQALARTWADMLVVEFEHYEFDVSGLTRFMQGLVDGGPTSSGHATPTVLATLPHNALSADEVRYNAWQARHVLAAGVHGILHTHARDAEAVKWFVASCRYAFQAHGRDVLPEGLRGGGEERAAALWGVSPKRYLRLADPWPLNPSGELLLGLKIEDRHGLADADAIAAVPGVSFAEWGPLDMGISLGEPGELAPPYSDQMNAARDTVSSATDKAGAAFYCDWNDPAMTVQEQIDHLLDVIGAKLLNVSSRELADYGRKRTGRTMPV